MYLAVGKKAMLSWREGCRETETIDFPRQRMSLELSTLHWLNWLLLLLLILFHMFKEGNPSTSFIFKGPSIYKSLQNDCYK